MKINLFSLLRKVLLVRGPSLPMSGVAQTVEAKNKASKKRNISMTSDFVEFMHTITVCRLVCRCLSVFILLNLSLSN